MMEKFDFEEGHLKMRDSWKSAFLILGGQYVMMILILMLLTWFADS